MEPQDSASLNSHTHHPATENNPLGLGPSSQVHHPQGDDHDSPMTDADADGRDHPYYGVPLEVDEDFDDDDDFVIDNPCYDPSYQPHPHLDPHHQHLYDPTSPFLMEPYASEVFDMSDDGGAPLVNYLDVAGILTNDVGVNAGASSLANDFAFADSDSDGSIDSYFDDHGGEGEGQGGGGGGGNAHTQQGNHYPNAFGQPQGPQPNQPNPPMPGTAWDFAAAAALVNPNDFPGPPNNPVAVAQQLELLAENVDDDGAFTVWLNGGHPVALTNPNPNTLGGGNYGLVDFLKHWASQGFGLLGLTRERGRFPWIGKVNDQAQTHLTHVQYADLEGDQCDFQGIDWEYLGVTRREARERRLLTYTNYVNRPGSDRWSSHLPDMLIPRTENFFRFRRMDIRRNVHLWHFQLRNVLACTSRSQAFYTGNGVVHSFDPVSGTGTSVMKLAETSSSQISTLAADHGVLIAGGFNGDYMLKNLESEYEDDGEESACREGIITNNISGITNHLQIHQARGAASPRAAFASNDMCFRVMDIETETFLSQENYEYPLNCTALSPDRRLRVMVGDHPNVLIAAAEPSYGTGRAEIVQELGGHRDYGFACDWADDGWTVATGFQDRAIKIWDARRWTNASGVGSPICTLRTEMAGVRGLRFSPVGSGKRVLVAAEEADYINIIDAQNFCSKQSFDIFGEIGGIAFTNGGQDLMALCCDRVRGGLIQLERCRVGAESAFWDTRAANDSDTSGRPRPLDPRWYHEPRSFDWPRSYFTEGKRIRESITKRRRKAAFLDALDPF